MKSFWATPCFALNLNKKRHSRSQIQCSTSGDSAAAALSVESVKVNRIVDGVSSSVVKEKKESDRLMIEVGHGHGGSNVEEKKREKVSEEEKLEPLWDDGYGTQSVKDYLDLAKEIIKPDGGPPRWFTPISCGPPLKDSPILLFLPGIIIWCSIVKLFICRLRPILLCYTNELGFPT